MIHQSSIFKGHRGAVTALAQARGNTFYSAGTEGLIVYWQLNRPNEGDVVVKLSGYVSALAFDLVENVLFATVNYKGLYFIEATSKRIIKFVDIPSTSFGKIALTNNSIIISTNVGEVLVLEKEKASVKDRFSTQLLGFSPFQVLNNQLWYATSKGIKYQLLESLKEQGELIKFDEKITTIAYWGKFMILFSDTGIYFLDIKKLNLMIVYRNNEVLALQQVYVIKDVLLGLSKANDMFKFKLSKNGLDLTDKTEFAHIGQINDILWIENHKFVITAGADKKIRVWQLN